MQNKSVTRKRIVRVHSDAPLARGTEITAGPAPIGTIGTALPNGDALALVRLDRIIDAETASVPLRAGPASITVDPVPLEAYRKAIADRPPAPDL
jgi:folate-binding Fe-S cluster repair protein YgfZ